MEEDDATEVLSELLKAAEEHGDERRDIDNRQLTGLLVVHK